MSLAWLRWSLSVLLIGALVPLWWPALSYHQLKTQEADAGVLIQHVPLILLSKAVKVSGPPRQLEGRYLTWQPKALHDQVVQAGWVKREQGGAATFYTEASQHRELLVLCRKFTMFYEACSVKSFG